VAVSHACSAVTTWTRSGSGAACDRAGDELHGGHSKRAASRRGPVDQLGAASIQHQPLAGRARSRVTYEQEAEVALAGAAVHDHAGSG
jgi:hypothetical protein